MPLPVPAACQRVKSWFKTTARCWLLICTIPLHSLPWTDPAHSSDSHTYTASSSEHWDQWDSAIHILPWQLPLSSSMARGSPDLINWILWIHDWDMQNGSQKTFFHQESQDPCNLGISQVLAFLFVYLRKRNYCKRRWGRWGKTSVSPQILGFANMLAALHKAFQSKTPGESRSLTGC